METTYEPKEFVRKKEPLPISKNKMPINKNILKPDTVRLYHITINQVHNHYRHLSIDKDNDIIKMLRNEPYDVKSVKKQLEYLKIEHYVQDLICRFYRRLDYIAGILSRINGFTKTRRIIVPYIHSYNSKREEKRLNKTIDDDVRLKLSFNKDDILSNLDKIDNNRDKLIYLLMMLIHTRRAHDYRFVKIINHIPDDIIDKNFNYYFDKIIYIYNTKNKRYCEISLPDEIISYIDINKPFLFGDKLYSSGHISKLIKDIFTKIYDYPYTAVEIRRLCCTNIVHNGTKKDKINAAKLMGHSVNEQNKYAYD